MKKKILIGILILLVLIVLVILFNNNALKFSKIGTYDYSEKGVVEKDVYIKSDGVILKNMIINSDLYIDESVGDGHVELHNVEVNGTLYVYGGGVETIYIIDGMILKLIGYVDGRIEAKDNTVINELIVKEPGMILENDESAPNAFLDVTIDIDEPKEEDKPVILDGIFDTVEVNAGSNVEVGEQTRMKYFPLISCSKEKCPENYKTRVKVNKSAVIEKVNIDNDVDITNEGEITDISYGDNVSEINMDGAEIEFPSSDNYEPNFINEPVFSVDSKGYYSIEFLTNNEGTVYYVVQPWFQTSNVTIPYQDVESGKGALIGGCGSASDPNCFVVASSKSVVVSTLLQPVTGSGFMGDKFSSKPPQGLNLTFDSIVWYVFKDKNGNYSDVGKIVYGQGYEN